MMIVDDNTVIMGSGKSTPISTIATSTTTEVLSTTVQRVSKGCYMTLELCSPLITQVCVPPGNSLAFNRLHSSLTYVDSALCFVTPPKYADAGVLYIFIIAVNVV